MSNKHTVSMCEECGSTNTVQTSLDLYGRVDTKLHTVCTEHVQQRIDKKQEVENG